MGVKTDTRSLVMEAWIRFLRAHSAVTRDLNAELVAQHGLTLNDYDVLVQLSKAPGRMLRRVDLSERVLLTPSGITRLLEGLERCGLVERKACESDARVVYAHLTDEGLAKFRTASRSHLASVRAIFAERFDDDELAALGELLGRLPLHSGGDCGGES